ncbi:hypothetical protein N7U49_47515 [Streptomyces sp. AD2-2]|nr:hypothetical protein N7U49_47515 [Streptomyces sp. AD2-2]
MPSWLRRRAYQGRAKECGVALPEFGEVCEHLASPTDYRPPHRGRRQRPVLERRV